MTMPGLLDRGLRSNVGVPGLLVDRASLLRGDLLAVATASRSKYDPAPGLYSETLIGGGRIFFRSSSEGELYR